MKTALIRLSSIPVGFGGLWLSLKLLCVIVEHRDSLSFASVATAVALAITGVIVSVGEGMRLASWKGGAE